MKAITKVLALTALAMIIAVGLCSILQSDESSADSVETDYDHYYYNQLNPYSKEVFDRWMTMYPTGEATATFQFDIDLSMLPTTAYSEVYGEIEDFIDESSGAAIYAFGNERYDVFWLKNSLAWEWNCSYVGEEITAIEITYTVDFVNDYPDPNLARTEVFDALCAIAVDGTNTYTKVRSIHDATVKTLSYAAYTDDSNFTIRSVFRDLAGDHSVVCEGYAKMFKALCDLHDVPCLLISGYGNSEAHMWNYVRMDDGKWYAVDCTWDDQDVIYQTYFLVGNETPVFNDRTYSQDHVIGDRMEYLTVPEISDVAYEAYHTVYFVSGGSKVETVDVAHGATIDIEPPTWKGFVFNGWKLNGEPFDIDTPVTMDMTLSSTWAVDGELSGTVGGITWSIDIDTCVMTITGTGAIPDFEGGQAPWKAYNDIIQTVTIGSGITTIGTYNFYVMASLTSVSIPASVTSIHNNAFHNCYRLADVCIAEGGLEPRIGTTDYGSIAKYAYVIRDSGESPIEHVDVPGGTLFYLVVNDTLYVIDADVTDDTLTFPKSIAGHSEYAIGACAFHMNTKIRNVVMLSDDDHHGVVSIGDNAFDTCLRLESIGFTEYLTAIGEYGVWGCINLKTVHLPATLVTLGESAFGGCSKMVSVDMSSCHVERIQTLTFNSCSKLTEVVLSSSTRYIDTRAFEGCSSLIRISFPASMAGIAASAFTGCEFSIGGVIYNDIPGSNNSQRAAAVAGKSFSCTDPTSDHTLIEDVYNLYYIVDGVFDSVFQYAAGEEVTLADLPSDVGHVYKGWYIPGTTVVDGKITMPANTLYVFAHSYIQYYTVTINLGDGTVPGYAGIWDEVDSHTYTLDIAGGTAVTSITEDDTSNLFFDSGDIAIDGYAFDHWTAYSPIVNGTLDITASYELEVYDLVLGNGAGTVAYQATSITITTEPTSAGYHVVGYSVDVDEQTYTLADAEGNLEASVPGYTDANGRWIRTSGATVSPSFLGNTYDVVLDKNGGDTGGTAKVTFRDCGLSQISAPAREEYIVAGYYLEAGCETLVAHADGSFVNSLDGYIQTGAWIRTSGVTLYAKWEVPTYAITLNGNGGSAGSATATHGSPTATDMTDCTRTGYTLKGYYLEPECYRLVLLGDTFKPNITGYTDGSGNWIAETGVTLYAKWSANMINMTLNKKEGTGNGQSYIYYGTSEIYTITSPGWLLHHPVAFYLDEGRTVLLYTIVDGEEVLECGVDGYTDANGVWIYPTAGTIDLYTGWAGNQVNLVFDGNGGSDGSAVAVHDSAVLTGVSHSVRSGYTLNGYYSASTDALVVTSAGQLVANVDTYTDSDGKWIGYNDMYALVDTVHLQARWTPITYDVVLDRNGGTADGSATVTVDSAALSSVSGPTRAGYHVSGYLTAQSEGVLVAAANGNLVASVTGYTDANGKWIRASDTTLYAQWEPDTYEIVLAKNGGSASGDAAAVYGSTALSQVSAPTWAGHMVTGYYLEAGCETLVADAEGNFVENLDNYIEDHAWTRLSGATLYAQWIAVYELTLDGNGGTGGSALAVAGQNAVSDLVACTMPGWIAIGYFTEADGGVRVIQNNGTLVADVDGYTDAGGNWIAESGGTLYAHWSPRQYNITLDSNGGDEAGSGKIRTGEHEMVPFTAATKAHHYAFGYYLATDYHVRVFDSNGCLLPDVAGYSDAEGHWIGVSNVTLYPKWEIDTTELYFDSGGFTDGRAIATYGSPTLTEIQHASKTGYYLRGYYVNGSTLLVNADGTLVANVDGYTDAEGNWISDSGYEQLIARWNPVTYDISIDANGGTADGSATVRYFATSLASESAPVRANYHITGYYTAAADGVKVINDDGTLVANVDGYTDGSGHWIRTSGAELFAYWHADEYALVLDRNGGTADGAGTVCYYDTAIVCDSAPTKTGYHIEGYYTAATDGTKVAAADGSLMAGVTGFTDGDSHWIKTEDATLYAVWAIDVYALVLDKNGGDEDGTADAVYRATSLSQIDAPTKEHYSVSGYYLEAGCETLVADAEGIFVENLTDYIENHEWIKTAGMTLYAKWTGVTTTVTLDRNGGTADGSVTAVYGQALPGFDAVTRTGYDLTGYFVNTGSSPMIVNPDGTLVADTDYADAEGKWAYDGAEVTLFAQWTPKITAITIDVNGGDGNNKQISGFYDNGVSSFGAVTRTGYDLTGYWTAAENGIMVLDVGGHMVNSEGYVVDGKWAYTSPTLTLYAQWIEATYTITLDKNGGSADGSAVVTYGSSAVSELSHAVRAGYTLDGYYSSNGEYLVMTSAGVLTQSADGYTDGSGNWIGYSTGQQGETIHLVAHWTAKTTAVTLDKNTGSADSSVTATYDLALPEFTPITRDGFNLAGYFTASSGGVKVINADGTLVANVDGYTADGKWAYDSATLTLFAQWAPMTTAIHLDANGGSPDVELTFTYGKNLSYGGSFSYPTMNGYGAIGMFTERTDGLCIAQDSANFTYNVDGYVTNGLWTYVGAELTLYVQWAPHTTTLNLFHNDGSGEYTQTTIRFNDTSAAAFVNPTRTGYTLAGYTQDGRTDNVLNPDGTLVQNYDSMVVNGKWRQGTSTVPLYAYWVKNTTEITVYAYNGSGDTTSSTATYGEGITAFEAFTWRGYTLNGYFTEPYSGVMVIDASGALQPDVDGYTADGVWILDRRALMLYAQWTPLTTEITLHRNTGTADGFVIATYNQPLPAFDGAVKTGYNATSYWISPSGINMLIDANGQLVDYPGAVEDGLWVYLLPTLTLYAQWAPKTTEVTIDANDGSGNTRSATATYDSGITAFAAPTRTGYTVEGYYTEAGRGVKVLDANGALVNSDGYVADGKWANESAALTLYAHWSARNITLFIDANGGDSDIQTAIHYDSTSATIIPPSRTGYNVTGYWSAAQNGVKVINDDGTLVNSAGYVIDDQWADVVVGGKWAYLSESITLYAQWAPKTTAITILANGGDDDSSVTATYGSALPGFPVILRTGYSNNGYFTAAEGGTRVIDSNGVLLFNVQGYSVDGRWANESAELTLYAHWTIWTIPITIDANGGDADRNVIATYDTLPEFDAVTRTGYVLTGYFNEGEGGAMVINADGTLVQNAAGYTADGKWTCVYDNLTLYAQWSPRSTAVILDKNGGAADRTTIATYDSGDLNAFEAVSRAGYVLTGYFTSADGGVMVVSSEGALAQNAAGYTAGGVWKYEGSDLTLYAQWQAHVTAIVLDKNGGQSDGQATVSYDGTSLTIAAYPVNTGYGVGGFLVASDGQKVAESNGRLLPNTDYTDSNGKWTSLAESVTFYASWSDIVVDVTLEGVEGTDGTAKAVFRGTLLDLVAPVRTGYDLEGYYADSARTLKVAQADGSLLSGVDGYTDSVAMWIKEESCTLYAQWTAKTYRITLDKDGGTADGYVIATYGSSALTEFTPPVRTGYDPVGFFTEPEHLVEIVKTNGTLVGGHTVYTDDGVWTNDLTQPLTLYPYWVAKHTSITLDRNGGQSDRSITAAYDAVLESFSPVSRTGYDLTGYWTAATGGTMVIGADGTLVADVAGYSADGKWANESASVTLYAQWTAGTTSITIVSNGGGAARSATATYGGGITAFDPIAREGYTLNGYFSEGEGGVMVITAAGALSDSQGYVAGRKWANASAELTLYAQWTAKTYTITLDKNGGTADGTATVTYGSSAITVTDAVWEWHTVATYTNNSGGGQWVINAQGALVTNAPGYTDADGKWIRDGDATVYAQWTAVMFTVTADPQGGTLTHPAGWTLSDGVYTKEFYGGTQMSGVIDVLGTAQKSPVGSTTYQFKDWTGYEATAVLSANVTVTAEYEAVIEVPDPVSGTTTVDTVTETSATMTSADIDKVKADAKAGTLEKLDINMKNGSFSLDSGSIQSLTSADLDVSIKKDEGVPNIVVQAAGGRSVYDIRIGDVHQFNGTLTITVDYQLKAGEDPNDLVVWNIKEDGTHEALKCTYANGKVTFGTTHLSYYAVMVDDSSPSSGGSDMTLIIAVVAVLAVAAVGAVFVLKRKKA